MASTHVISENVGGISVARAVLRASLINRSAEVALGRIASVKLIRLRCVVNRGIMSVKTNLTVLRIVDSVPVISCDHLQRQQRHQTGN